MCIQGVCVHVHVRVEFSDCVQCVWDEHCVCRYVSVSVCVHVCACVCVYMHKQSGAYAFGDSSSFSGALHT